MQKKLVQSSLAMAAAAALGLGGAFVTAPAMADEPELTQVTAQKAAKSISEVNAFGFDNGTLHLGVEGEGDVDSAEIEKLQKKYGADNVVVKAGIPKVEAYAADDLVGGAGYLLDVPSTGKGGACSTGFSGWDDEGNPVVLTAGHCAEDTDGETGEDLGSTEPVDTELPGSAPARGGEGFEPAGIGSLGTWGYNKYGSPVEEGDDTGSEGDIDFAVINVDESTYNVKNGITDWSDDDLSSSVSAIKSVGSHSEGTVQKSGRTTGLTDGQVIPYESFPFEFMNVSDRWVHGFGVESSPSDPFSQPGDSGGGVFQGDTAVGVISGGGPAEWDDGTPFELGWVADLDYSLEQSGADFNLEEPSDEPEAPAAPKVEDQTIEPEGAITGKAAAGADVKVTWTGAEDGEATAKADDSGNFTLEGPSAEGEYDAKAVATVDGESSDAAAFTVTVEASDDAGADGDEANADADADAKDDEANADADADAKDAEADAAADGKDDEADSDADGDEKPEAPKVGDQTVVEGGQITGQAAPNVEVELTWKSAEANAGSAQAVPGNGNTTVKTDDDGKFTAEAPAEAGDYNYTAVVHANGQESAPAEFTVTVEAEEAPAERNLTVDPEEIAASDFVQEDKGVQITAEGFDEGEKVTLEVVAGPENVEGITLDEVANEDGVVGFSIYGTNASDPSAYLGQYDLEVTGANDTEDEDALTGSFSVVADEDGNGGGNDGDDDGNGDGGSDLPRTGAELTGLAAGAGLLVVGGAAVVLTMRRKKNN
jgi:LPXTG-motif cell wall-anchored protein